MDESEATAGLAFLGADFQAGAFPGDAPGMSRSSASAFVSGVLAVAFCLGCPQKPPETPTPVTTTTSPEDSEIKSVKAAAPPPEAPKDVGDLDAIKKRGTLRILVFGTGEDVLPRAGASMNRSEEAAVALAEHLGVRPELVTVGAYSELIPALLDGRGDIIAARMAITEKRKEQIAFTRATTSVDEVLVSRKGDASAPKTLQELAGKTITVRPSSSYFETLTRLATKEAKGGGAVAAVAIAPADEARDSEQLVADVGDGKLQYTVCDSDLLLSVQAYNDKVESTLTLRKGREIALALRPTNLALKAAADAWVIEKSLTKHATLAARIDLDEIKKRGSIRMLTRNNAVSYFLYKGTQQGFDYEWVKLFAKENGLRLDVVVPPEAKDLIPWLNEGRGDVIAAQMTVTPEREAAVAFTPPYSWVDEVVVQRSGEAPLKSLAELKGKTLHVRPSSSYRRTLDALQATAGPFTVVDAAEDVETEALIARVARGELPLTVADSTIAAVEQSWRNDIQTSVSLASGNAIALATRKDAPKLQAALAAFVSKHVSRTPAGVTKGSVDYNVLRRTYFEARKKAEEARQDFKETGKISAYDDLIRLHATNYGIDWRLMAAQAYQESRFDPAAKSWVGALGLFQVMPRTGAEMGFVKLEDPSEGVHAGVRYMAQLIDSFEKDLPFKQRVRFALAAYNAGRGHVEDARRLAQEMGLDPNRWFKHTEVAMLRLQDHAVARKMRHGYCRGEEPVKYVSEIQSRYDNYITIVPDPGLDQGPKP